MLAFGVLIPIEAICDVPGIGQLTWKAAIARDLPLLAAWRRIITLVVALVAALGELVEGTGLEGVRIRRSRYEIRSHCCRLRPDRGVSHGAVRPGAGAIRYDRQFRDSPGASPGGRFLLGTDEIGRDRFSRLLYATRISIFLAPAAAAVSVAMALFLSVPLTTGRGRNLVRPAVSLLTTICLALPWIFLFIILRAELPLDTGPIVSVLLTFGLMGVAGWAWPARIFAASIGQMEKFGMDAAGARVRHFGLAHRAGIRVAASCAPSPSRSSGFWCPRIFWRRPVSDCSAWVFAEPLPSWGNLLRDLQHPDLIARIRGFWRRWFC